MPPHDDTPSHDDRRLQGRSGESPDRIELPFWLDACLLLDPPKTAKGKPRSAWGVVYPVARALMADRIRARGDEAVQLDRTALARWAGINRANNARWIFSYLARIGFLEIHRTWTSSGKSLDTFDVFPTPPANYVGPSTYAEVDMAVRQQSATGKPPKLFAQVNPKTSGEVLGSDPRTSSADFAQVNPKTSGEVLASSRGTSGTSIEEVPEVVGESATPPADAGADADALHDEIDWARTLIRQLPWRTKGRRPTIPEARELASRFRKATDQHGFTEAGVRDLALAKLTSSDQTKNPVRWVTGAFDDARLNRICPAADVEPLDDEPLTQGDGVVVDVPDQQPNDDEVVHDAEIVDEQPPAQDAEAGPSPVDWLTEGQWAEMSPWERQGVRLVADGARLPKNMRSSLNRACVRLGLDPLDGTDAHERALLKAEEERRATAEPA